jgi:hypothetical protein
MVIVAYIAGTTSRRLAVVQFGWSRITADNFINVAKASGGVKNFGTLNVPRLRSLSARCAVSAAPQMPQDGFLALAAVSPWRGSPTAGNGKEAKPPPRPAKAIFWPR